MSETPLIQLRDLVKEFRSWRRSLRALDGVDLEVGQGEVFGLLGANGAGKTTLVKILLGLTRPTSGEVLVQGANPRRTAARLRVGYLPEGHRFPGYLTGEQAIRLFGRLAGVDERFIDRQIPALLDQVGLGSRGKDRISRYSKGMTQRLGLAAALVDQPTLLFLDEPTDGVDPVGRREIRDVLLRTKELGTTIFINSHLLSEVERTCDRVAILHRGRILRTGTVEGLTHTTQRYRLRLAESTPIITETLTVEGTHLTANNGHFEVDAANIEALNRLLDNIRGQNHLIAELTPMRSDLEDVFIQVVGDEEKILHDNQLLQSNGVDSEPVGGGR